MYTLEISGILKVNMFLRKSRTTCTKSFVQKHFSDAYCICIGW